MDAIAIASLNTIVGHSLSPKQVSDTTRHTKLNAVATPIQNYVNCDSKSMGLDHCLARIVDHIPNKQHGSMDT